MTIATTAAAAPAAGGMPRDRARRRLLPLGLAAVAMGLGQTTLLTALPLLMERTGLSLAQLGAGLALGSGLFLIGAPLWTRASERLGRRPVVALALLGFAVSHALLLWQAGCGPQWRGQQSALLLGRVLYGLTASALVPTCQAWLGDLVPPVQRLAVLSRLSAGLTLGRLLGPALAAASLWLEARGPLWLLALAAWPALLVLPLATAPERRAPVTAPGGLRWRPLLPWLAFAFAMQAALGQLQYAIGPWLALRFDLRADEAATQLGAMLSACAAVILALQWWLLPRLRAGHAMLQVGGAALALAALAFVLAPRPWAVWAGFAVLGCGSALLVPAYTARASLAVGDGRQSRASAGLAMAHTLGYSASAGVAGVLFGWWSPAPFWVAAALGVAIALAAAFVSRSSNCQ